jgi:molybdate transport system substrate-binding protein
LAPAFERASGFRYACSFAPSARIAQMAADGEASDAVIATDRGIDNLIAQGRVGRRQPRRHRALRHGAGGAEGRAAPDISSVEAFKRTMLAAKSLAMSNPVGGGQSGANLARIFEELGIAEAMKDKTVYGPGGPAGLIGNFLLRKEVEIGIQQLPELMAVPGIDIVGPLPDGIQSKTVFSVGLSTSARHPDGARALIAFLATPEAAKVMQDKGMEPP